MSQLATPRIGNGKAAPKISDMLERPDTKKRMLAILPKHLSADRMLRIAAMAIWKTPKLQDCHPMTLLGSIMTCGTLGLEPNTPLGHAYLLPFENRRAGTVDVTLIIGYTGYIDLARRSGKLISIHADVVREGDEFDYIYGSEAFLRHRPGEAENVPTTHAYCHMKVQGGEGFRVMSLAQINKARARSKSPNAGPWVTDFDAMAAKTPVRRLARFMPLSLELASANDVDERRVNFRAIAESSDAEILTLGAGAYATPDDDQSEEPPAIKAPTEGPFFPPHDQETGEIREPEPTQAQPKPQARQAPKAAAGIFPEDE